jgi:heme O synthase-like polyprenyltransferase
VSGALPSTFGFATATAQLQVPTILLVTS